MFDVQQSQIGMTVAELGVAYPGQNQSGSPPWVETLVDCPGALQGVYTYAIPAGLTVQAGDILSVGFGAAQVGAIALRCLSQLPAGLDPAKIRPIEDIISPSFFPPSYWVLLERVSAYYHTPLIQTIRTALPPGLLQRSQRRIKLLRSDMPADMGAVALQLLQVLHRGKGDYAWKYLQQQVKNAQRGLQELRRRGWVESYLQPIAPTQAKRQQAVTLLAWTEPLSARQRTILDLLNHQGGEVWLQDLLRLAQTSLATLKTLEDKGCIAIAPKQRLRLETGKPQTPDRPQTLTTAQAAALATIQQLEGYSQVLLHGVTGSGKTEVYLQAIAPLLEAGKSALVLVPEIGLTPQLTDRFRSRFGDRVCVYHSALSDGERYDTWRQLLEGTPQVIIGTRSAVFSPLPRLGLIILDEEHDSGFKQDQLSPCYHARTVARWRAELEDCPLILGSATPSLESWTRVHTPPSSPPTHYLSLPQRVHARPLPPIEIVDMRAELQRGNRSIFSYKLADALENLQAQKQQGLLFIPRRGHSTFVSCRSCGYVVECPNCSVSLTYHFSSPTAHSLLRCHYCNYACTHPPQCPECQSPYFKYFGSGTQRVERELLERFPQLRLIRFDSDTTRNKGGHRLLLERFAAGEADLMIGTQMLTKGLDLPQVSFVGVLSADGLLNLPDFRAGERTFQTLTQVAGRAGRGNEPGQVLLQTYTPHHPVIQAVQRYQFEAFMQEELNQRSSLHYPPQGQLILLRLSGLQEETVATTAIALADQLQHHLAQVDFPWELLGPAPANILRVAKRYRWQILLKFPHQQEGRLPAYALPVEALRSNCPDSVRLTIDVDPLSLA